MVPLQVDLVCFWRGLGTLFGVRKWLKIPFKPGSRLFRNLEAILNEIGVHFGCFLGSRMAVPCQNFRFWSGSRRGLGFGSGQVGLRGWFLQDSAYFKIDF